MTMPMPVSENDIRAITSISGKMLKSGKRTCTSGASSIMMQPWMSDSVVPASALPMTMDVRGTGATRISLRNPNSRSQMMEIADCIEVKMVVMAMMPGKMNWV